MFLDMSEDMEVDDGSGAVEDSSDDDTDTEDGVPDSFRPEITTLPLPSALGPEWCSQDENHSIVQQELALRKGQANDVLHQLRVGLAEKSFLFRTEIRNANSQSKKTRAWDGFHTLENNLKHLVRAYSQSRQALVRLGAGADVLAKYRVLKAEDIKVSTAVIDIRKPSRAEATLAWFWRMDVQGDTESDSWMAERELF